jgi:hypothetical protein
MIELTADQFAQSDFATQFALNREGSSSRFRPGSPNMEKLLLIQLDLDKNGESQAVRVQVPAAVLNHLVLRPALVQVLTALASPAESEQEWFTTFEPPELSLQESTLTLSIDRTDATFTFQRKRKGFWSLFSH